MVRRIVRHFRKLRRRPHFITDLWSRYDNWCRPKEYL